MKYLPISLIVLYSIFVFANNLPSWVTDTSLVSGDYGFVVCSESSLDPEKAKRLAEDKCLSSASKGLGVSLEVKSKSVQSLSGADSSEVVEAIPINKIIKCEWQDQFIEKDKDSYRVWLRCKYSKKAISATSLTLNNLPEDKILLNVGASHNSTLRLFLAPRADKILIFNTQSGLRVIENPQEKISIDLKEGDTKVTCKKLSFKDYVIDVKNLKDAEVMVKSILFEKDI